MPVYCYKNPNNEEIIEAIRPISKRDDPLILEDGTSCDRVPFEEFIARHRGKNHSDKGTEVWDLDSDYVKKMSPKFIKTRDGTKLSKDQYYKYL